MRARLLGAVRCALVAGAACAPGAWAQGGVVQDAGSQTAAAEGELTFVFDWPVQMPPHYEISIAPDGMGSYRDGTADAVRPLVLSRAVMGRVAGARAVLIAAKTCETTAKHLAQTGTKMLRLEQSGRMLMCRYNYSDDKRVMEATAAFQAISMTMEEAPKLEHLHRFDRLGLDAELGSFVQSVRDGRAIEVGNIAATLRSLASDTDLLERVRLRAAELLQGAGAAVPAS